MPTAATTQTATVGTLWSPLFQRALPNIEGKTFTSLIIEFPPSAGAAPHRHGAAFVWAYVLAGTIRIKLNDEPTRTCREGESWLRSRAPTTCSRKTTARRNRQSCLPSSSPIREIRSS